MSDGDAPFRLVAARSGRALEVGTDQSIAEVLVAAGVEARTGCLGGGCGACITRIVRGTPDHRDVYLTQEERDSGLIAICVSRARGPELVLDI